MTRSNLYYRSNLGMSMIGSQNDIQSLIQSQSFRSCHQIIKSLIESFNLYIFSVINFRLTDNFLKFAVVKSMLVEDRIGLSNISKEYLIFWQEKISLTNFSWTYKSPKLTGLVGWKNCSRSLSISFIHAVRLPDHFQALKSKKKTNICYNIEDLVKKL